MRRAGPAALAAPGWVSALLQLLSLRKAQCALYRFLTTSRPPIKLDVPSLVSRGYREQFTVMLDRVQSLHGATGADLSHFPPELQSPTVCMGNRSMGLRREKFAWRKWIDRRRYCGKVRLAPRTLCRPIAGMRPDLKSPAIEVGVELGFTGCEDGQIKSRERYDYGAYVVDHFYS